MLDIGVNALTLINNIGGLKTVLFALVGVIATLKAESIATGISSLTMLIPNLASKVIDLTLAFSNTRTSTLSLDQSLKAMGITASATQLALGGMFAVLTAGIAIYSRLKQEQEQATQNAIDSANSFKSYSDTLNNTLSKIQNESTTKSQLLEINKSLNGSYDDESEKLKDINDLRAENIELLHQEAVAKAEQTIHETGAEATKQRRYLQSSNIGQESDYERVEGLTGTPEERLKKTTELLKEFEANQEDLSNAELRRYSALSSYYNKLSADVENAKNVVETYDEAQKIVNSSTDEWIKTIQENSAELENQGSQVQYTDEEIQQYAEDMGISFEEAKELLTGTATSAKDLATSVEDLAKSLDLSNEQLERFSNLMDLENLEEFLQNLYNIRQASEEASGGIDSLQSALESALDAQAEYADQGYLTLDTFQSLMGISAEYLVALQNENGQLEINQTTLSNLVEQMKIAKIEELQAAATADILAYSQGNVGQMSEFAKSLVADLGVNIEDTGRQAETASSKMINFSSSIATAVRAMGGEFHWDDKDIMAIVDGYKTVAKSVKDLTIDTSTYGNVASKSHSKATESVKEEKTEAEKLKEEYKEAIDFMLKQYDKKIDKIKEAKEAQLDAIDAEIKALERERDAREKYWDDQIDNLEKENTERERNIELQEKLQALALAQQSKVMLLKDGQFTYAQDEGEVASAEQDLAETQEQQAYERQKEALEELRDAELEWYNERIQALEDYKEKVEASYDEQIADLEAQKEAINEVLEESAVNQQEYWDTMMAQLSEFVAKWNAKVGEMKSPSILGKSTGDNSVKVSSKLNAYASGKGSVGDSELAVVGENPKYREIVIGSKLNNDQGAVMALKRGSGVVNAGATNTLASIFNALNGQNSNAQKVSNSTSNTTSITIGSISLPEVKDGKGFVDYLQNFSADMTQLAFAR